MVLRLKRKDVQTEIAHAVKLSVRGVCLRAMERSLIMSGPIGPDDSRTFQLVLQVAQLIAVVNPIGPK
jgi:hypothetical protein